MCRYWMASAPEQAGVLYIDGHVRVYNGQQTQLPRHHVARQKLCLRATTDYWVNAMDGQPFMVVNPVLSCAEGKAVDPGLIKVIENDILPELEARVPAQAERTTASAKPYPHKFTLVFDREGYSPELMARMKAKQVAGLTYHKYPGDDGLETEFSEHLLTLPTGQTTHVKRAERSVCLSNKLWVREIRLPHRTRTPNFNFSHRLSSGFNPHWGNHVCQMVTGKLLQVYARTLQPGKTSRL
jgi:hypothetical protein